MKVEYSKAFVKAVRKLSGKVLDSVRNAIQGVMEARCIDEITDCKKLVGYDFVIAYVSAVTGRSSGLTHYLISSFCHGASKSSARNSSLHPAIFLLPLRLAFLLLFFSCVMAILLSSEKFCAAFFFFF